jgi:hypothetical protein
MREAKRMVGAVLSRIESISNSSSGGVTDYELRYERFKGRDRWVTLGDGDQKRIATDPEIHMWVTLIALAADVSFAEAKTSLEDI